MGSREVVASECAFGGYPVNAEGRADRAYPGYARTYRASRRSEPSTIFSTPEPVGQGTVASRC